MSVKARLFLQVEEGDLPKGVKISYLPGDCPWGASKMYEGAITE